MIRTLACVIGALFAFTGGAFAQKADQPPTSRSSVAKGSVVVEIAAFGMAELDRSDLSPSIRTKTGEAVSSVVLDADRDRIIAFYRSKGFSKVQVKVEQWRAKNGEGIVVVFRVVEGPRDQAESRTTSRDK